MSLNGHRVTRRSQQSVSAAHTVKPETVTPTTVWYQCDDASVSTLTEQQLLLKLKRSRKFTPYLLFYTKCYQ